jgi:GR25 family glycosyltransferase involved in LPS biosynthesis
MQDLNEAFPYKLCINLDRRPERWQEMSSKFERFSIRDVRRFSAVDGQNASLPEGWSDSPGAYGCLRSHLEIVQEARRLGWPSVLIFEDDAAFDPQIPQNFRRYFPQVPADWDMLHFGAHHMATPLDVAPNVVKITSANSTFAYALKHTVFDSFIELNSRALKAVDLNNRDLQSKHACYSFTPHLAWVEDVTSDVQVRRKYHWYLKESLVLYGNGMDRILKETCVIIAYQNPARSEYVFQNLQFLIRFYDKYLGGVAVVVVEQGDEPTFDRLPCRHIFRAHDGPLNPALCFNAGMEQTDRRFLIFSGSDLFVEEWDIRGNLRICEQFDCASGFSRSVNLTPAATELLRTSKPMLLTPWFDASDYSQSEKQNVFSDFSVFNRASLEGAGGWNENSSSLSLNTRRELRVFSSPNDALRMASK